MKVRNVKRGMLVRLHDANNAAVYKVGIQSQRNKKQFALRENGVYKGMHCCTDFIEVCGENISIDQAREQLCNLQLIDKKCGGLGPEFQERMRQLREGIAEQGAKHNG